MACPRAGDIAAALGGAADPDACSVAALASRRVLPLLAAALHVPAVHGALLEQAGLLQPPATPAVIKARSALRDAPPTSSVVELAQPLVPLG